MYVVEITDPIAKQFSVAYQPERFECQEPEQAAVLFQHEISTHLDLSVVVERLSKGKEIRHEDRDGRTVTARQIQGAHV
jgi:hypothetical protein